MGKAKLESRTEAKVQNCNQAIGIHLPHPCSISLSPSASPPPNRSSKALNLPAPLPSASHSPVLHRPHLLR
ncbi:hypothetical protein SLEP1_g58624 [Rubroshorea leprosula]|uniref:Uncharacterized protein n=1 Tax=Rubroshorea leprosula TaxID=152421 RepID=A0AAV5MQ11_9ROSI|nr:hypothetical protein SLEP1_g58624 [Rubroshorea leprosula]